MTMTSATTDFPRRRLGTHGPEVSAIGLGCMGMSDFYGPADDAASLAVLHHALDLGISLLDTRSEERRVGKECRRLCRSRWSPYH
jgi:aryl-alcohol dehydrogenase-like predicted oxidoreductase